MKPNDNNPRQPEQNKQTEQRKGQSSFGADEHTRGERERTDRPNDRNNARTGGVERESNPAVKARQPEGSSKKDEYSSKNFSKDSKDGIKKDANKDSFVKNKDQSSNKDNKGGFRK